MIYDTHFIPSLDIFESNVAYLAPYHSGLDSCVKVFIILGEYSSYT